MFRVSQMLAGKSRHVLGAGGLWSAGGRAASVAGCERFSTGSSMQKKEKESPPSITIEVSEGDEELVEEEEEVVTDSMQPRLIVKELDKNIVGQADAKRAVAVALRNRWRRMQLSEDMRREITPKNILMIGPTGCGKTEIARRLAQLADAPFIKVEATKFTEVGFHGRDVDMIIRDLLDNGIMLAKKRMESEFHELAELKVRDRIVDLVLGLHGKRKDSDIASAGGSGAKKSKKKKGSVNEDATAESMKRLYDEGGLDELNVKIGVPNRNLVLPAFNQEGSGAMNDLLGQLKSLGVNKPEKKSMKVKDARPFLYEEEMRKMLDDMDVKKEAIEDVEQNGIVFIDEIDKICSAGDRRGSADASAEGVQKDLLPLIEGSTISTKHGNVATDHILFLASGAFHQCKPADLLPELQGRLPIRVELKGLDESDLYRILTEPVSNIIRQNKLLIEAEGVELVFEEGAVREIARLAAEVNQSVENIGARRLHTCVERIIEEISFDAADMCEGTTITIDEEMVTERLGDMVKSVDLSKFIL